MEDIYGFQNDNINQDPFSPMQMIKSRLTDARGELRRVDEIAEDVTPGTVDLNNDEILEFTRRNKIACEYLTDAVEMLQKELDQNIHENEAEESNPESNEALAIRIHGLEKNVEIISTILLKNNLG